MSQSWKTDAPFSVEDHYDVRVPALYPCRNEQCREISTVEDAVTSGGAPGGFLDGLSDAGIRECLRLRLRRIRSRGSSIAS